MRDQTVALSPHEILELSSGDPERAMKAADQYLEGGHGSEGDRSTVYRAMSMAVRLLGNPERALETATEARALAAGAGDGEQELLAVLAMTGPMAMTGRSAEALELVEDASSLATTPYLRARIAYQLAVVRMIRGDVTGAIPLLESALDPFRGEPDPVMLRSALQNLGNLEVVTGRLDRAERHLLEALDVALDRDEGPAISGIKQNLGLLASYRGDIPEALSFLAESDEIYMRLTGESAPQHATRCDVLMSAGLFREAQQLASEIADAHRVSGDPEHLPEALVVQARAALLAEDPATAGATAAEAVDLLRRQGRESIAHEVERIALEARYRLEGASQALLEEAASVASGLRAEALVVPAAQAALLAGRIAIDLEDRAAAVGAMSTVAEVGAVPVELRVEVHAAKALLRQLEGDGRGADAAARSGLRLIDEYQAVLGATDLRMGLEQHGVELGSIGLGLALASGRPRRVLRWMERTRARSLRFRPVVADDDAEIQGPLAELRRVEADLRSPENRNDRSLLRRRRRLQEQVRRMDRRRRATQMISEFDVPSLVEEVADRALLEIAVHDGRLVGVLVSRGRARLLELGAYDAARREIERVRFGMRRSARLGRPFDREPLEVLDSLLLGGLQVDVDDLVIVPPPSLMSVPWSALPSFSGTSLTVSPSAEMWWRSLRGDLRTGASVVVAGGPGLAVADEEVESVRRLYDQAITFSPDSSVHEVRQSLEGASTAHIACHATFAVENPMFSSLRLGDGDLYVYDIERLSAPPAIVVLSACDSGYTDARSGDELAGLTSALLTMGTRSVIASVGLVPDSPVTSDLMVGFHQGLIAGSSPARALSSARSALLDDPQTAVVAASFICVGA